MTAPRTQRRLAAILAADVAGYSRLMGVDEAGTLAALRLRWREVLTPAVARHRGRVVKVMGDGVLVEFGSAVDAVECAVAVQAGFVAANEGLPADRHIVLRIGINLGDVIVEGSDLYGDGVNIAARLEGLAEPGGICVSAKVWGEVRGKVALAFADAGEVALKNIVQPIRIYQSAVAGTAQRSALPMKPAIAVLPFTNMSGDPEQEYFSDGLTEDIITELSRFKGLNVIARNSTFHYKGKVPNIQTLGRELGVPYVVEGSVRKAGNRVRVTAQLIDTATGSHLWADRYDRDLADIFALQDELVRIIVGIVPVQIDRFAVTALQRKPVSNFTAYDCELRGRRAMWQWNEGLDVARGWFEQAIAADPDYALAHAGLAMTYGYGIFALGVQPETAIAKARQHATRAIELDDQDPRVNAGAAFSYHVAGEPQLALALSERAIALNPNDPFALHVRGAALTYVGYPEQALEWFAMSERLEPYARNDARLDVLADCHQMLGNWDKAIEILESLPSLPPFLWMPLAAAYARADRADKATWARERYFLERPVGHDPVVFADFHSRMCVREVDKDYWRESYRMAGFDV